MDLDVSIIKKERKEINMYQVALKFKDHYQILNGSVVYCDKKTAINVLENLTHNAIYGDAEYVLLEYAPFKVYRYNNGKLINITTKKEKN